MALNFPSSPSDGQVYYDSVSGNRYVYNSANTAWVYSSNATISISGSSNTQVLFNYQNTITGSDQFSWDSNVLYASALTISSANLFIAGSNVLAGFAAVNSYSQTIGASSNAWANSKVSSVTGTAGQIFSSGGTTPTLNLVTTGVASSIYGGATNIPVLNIDVYGRVTSASNVSVQGMDYAYANAVGTGANNQAGLMANASNSASTTRDGYSNNWANTVSGYSNTWANTVAGYANTWANTKVASVTGTAGQIFSSGGTTPTINLISTGVSATTYGGASQVPAIVVDAFGRITSASNVSVQGMDYSYANAVGLGANNQSGLMANAANSSAITREGYSNNWANTVAGYANTWANTKLSNTSGVSFAGDLNFPTGNVTIGANGHMYVGGTPASGVQMYVGGPGPSTTDSYTFLTDQTIPATATSSATAFTSNPSTVAASFTLPSLNHFLATQGSIGVGSTVTNQRGFYAFNTLVGATNNYGFYSDIANGSNRWNFYASGTAYNFFAGGTGFGTGPLAYTQQRIGGTGPSSSNLTYSVYADQTAPATTTSEFASFYSIPNTTASAFNLGSLFHFIALQGTKGAGSSITNQFGFYVGNNLTGANNNYGYYSNIPIGANRWNFFSNGTANNYFGGNVGIGTTSPGYILDVTGSVRLGNSVAQGNPNATDITANAQLLVSGQGGNYLAFGQYGSTTNYAQWIQSGFSNPTTATYNLVLQPLGGNVGIAVASPTYKLHVDGTANVTGYLTANTIGSDKPDGNLVIQSTSSFSGGGYDSIYLKTVNSINPMTIDSFGGIWLGLLPSPKPFRSDQASTTLWSYYDMSFTYPQSGFVWNSYYDTGTYRRITSGFASALAPASDGAITFSTNGVSAAANTTLTLTPRMRIEANGNVSIGRTSATTYKLDVNGSINIAAGGAIAGGFTVDSFNAGANIAAYGTWTPNPTNGNYQYATCNGSVTIAVPASNCAIDILWYNGLGPGSVTFSGYQAASGGGGDAYLSTASYEYILMIRRINGLSTYTWKALQ